MHVVKRCVELFNCCCIIFLRAALFSIAYSFAFTAAANFVHQLRLPSCSEFAIVFCLFIITCPAEHLYWFGVIGDVRGILLYMSFCYSAFVLRCQVDKHTQRDYDFVKPVVIWLVDNGMVSKVHFLRTRQSMHFLISCACWQEDVCGATMSDLPGAPSGPAPLVAFVKRTFRFLNPEVPAPGGAGFEVMLFIFAFS